MSIDVPVTDPTPVPIPSAHAALVLGASGDIGSALATEVAAAGFAMTVSGRDEPALASVQRRLAASGTSVIAHPADMTDEAASSALLRQHLASFGRLDLLVVAAGASRAELLADADLAKSRKVIETNVTSVLGMVRAALPALRRSATDGGTALVVLLGSLVARRPASGFAVYSATKAAVVSLARSINLEHGSGGVRATAICPGFVDTAMTKPLRNRVGPMLPVTDIAECLRFLLRLSSGAYIEVIELARTGVSGDQP